MDGIIVTSSRAIEALIDMLEQAKVWYDSYTDPNWKPHLRNC